MSNWKINYVSAIVCVGDGANAEFKKYRNIAKSKRSEFETFARKQFPGARYVNYYERSDKTFIERKYL